ncbi:hypothetical protein RSAG8_13616, partial [Rhizoctonia solani AG-8 WAC10335]
MVRGNILSTLDNNRTNRPGAFPSLALTKDARAAQTPDTAVPFSQHIDLTHSNNSRAFTTSGQRRHPSERMATVANAQRRLTRITGTIRYKFIRPTLFATKTVASIVDPLGLRQSGSVVFGVVEALKAPKQNRVKAQDQMVHIDQTIASIQQDISPNAQEDGGYEAIYLYYEAQKFVDVWRVTA